MPRPRKPVVPHDKAHLILVLPKETMYTAQLHSYRSGHLTLEDYVQKLIADDIAKTPKLKV